MFITDSRLYDTQLPQYELFDVVVECYIIVQGLMITK